MLELKNISFEVPSEKGIGMRKILDNINITVDKGNFVVITGPNGGGKSTLAKIIMGMVTPTHGRIFFNGKDITDLSITERANAGIGFAFQQPVQFKGLSVRRLLELAVGEEISTDRACGYLSEVGLCAADYIDRDVNSSLSGGELKRIEIATLLARKTPLSIFDEPEAGIDLWSFQALIRVFEKVQSESKGSVIIISHQERILQIADRIVVISEGKVAAEDSRNIILPELMCDSGSCKFYGKGEKA